MKSIIQKDRECYICGNPYVEEHHIFGGPFRKASEKYGLKVYLCHNHHNEPPNGAHFNKELMQRLHEIGQQAFEEVHGHKEFMRIFKRNYL